MAPSLLYHGFGVRGYNHINTLPKGGEIIFTVEQDLSTMRCANYTSRLVGKRGKTWRIIRTVPIGLKTVWIRLAIHRVHCMIFCLVRLNVPIRGAVIPEHLSGMPLSCPGT
jgi:hypothetical protein